jgi:DNA-binding transcriptional MerR regulator
MHIQQFAKKIAVSPETIRHYERIGILPQATRAENGYRIYAEADLERLHFISRARQLDFSLEAISEIIGLRERGEVPCAYVITQISVKIDEIDQKIAALTQIRAELGRLEQHAAELPLAEIEAKSCMCHLIENQQISIEKTEDAS